MHCQQCLAIMKVENVEFYIVICLFFLSLVSYKQSGIPHEHFRHVFLFTSKQILSDNKRLQNIYTAYFETTAELQCSNMRYITLKAHLDSTPSVNTFEIFSSSARASQQQNESISSSSQVSLFDENFLYDKNLIIHQWNFFSTQKRSESSGQVNVTKKDIELRNVKNSASCGLSYMNICWNISFMCMSMKLNLKHSTLYE